MPIVPRYSIRLYDPAAPGVLFRTVRLLASARYRNARNDAGDFDVAMRWVDDTAEIVEAVRAKWLIEFWLDDQTFLFGGQVRRREISSSRDTGTVAIFSGPSYLGWLANYRMLPATGSAPVTIAADHADDMAKSAVRSNVTTTGDASRNCPWFASENNLSAVATAASYSAPAFDTVLETVQAIGKRADKAGTPFVFDIIRDTDNALRFKTWAPIRGIDRSLGTNNPVQLDLRSGNVQSLSYVEDGADVENAVWALGSGELAARYRVFSTDEPSITTWGRIEGSVEVSGQAAADVDKKLTEELSDKAPGALTFSAKAAGIGRYVFGRDFNYGDRVTAADLSHGIGVSDEITAVEVRLGQGAQPVVDLTVGLERAVPGNPRLRLAKLLRTLRYDIGAMARPRGS
jgi:hypothetical protein